MFYKYSAYGQHRIANQLHQQKRLVLGCYTCLIWLHHDLESFKKCLMTLDPKIAQEDLY